ncbi:diguanylate cyclase [Marinomonas fungiae]|uniref:sensor domain-containing diguanylate cyclase n=1 Tax=Marinomonas fungiae TaxID=1137284 RepID=UPI003A8E57AA
MSDKALSLLEIMGLKDLSEILDNFYQISSCIAYLMDGDGFVVARPCLSGQHLDVKQSFQRSVNIAGCEPFFVCVVSQKTAVNQNQVPPKIQALLDSLTLRLQFEVAAKLPSKGVEFSFEQDLLPLKQILQVSSMAVGWSNIETGEIEYINPSFEQMFGYCHSDIPTLVQWFEKAFPDEVYRQTVLLPYYENSLEAQKRGDLTKKTSLVVACKDGSLRHVELTVTYMGCRRLVSYIDVTDYFNIQERLQVSARLLEMVAKGSKLKDIMLALVEQVQSELPGSICSVLMVDGSQRLRSYVAPNLPNSYLKAIDGVAVGPSIGSCGTAAYRKERVVVENIYDSELWQNFTHLADLAGVKSCWSDPIIASSGEVLGTFAIYYPYPSVPTEQHLELIDFASNLASVAIENRRGQQALEKRANFDHLTGLSNRGHFFESAEQTLETLIVDKTPYCMMMLDIDHFKQINDRFGHRAGDKVLIQVAGIMLDTVEDVNLVGRIGGEEFAIMLIDVDQQKAFEIAEQIRIAVEAQKVPITDEQAVSVTISAGIAQCHEHSESAISIDRLFGRADEALYQAKSLGRNRVKVFSKNNVTE